MAPRQPVLVAGGGPAALESLLALRELAGPDVELELVAPDPLLVVRAYEVLSPFHEGTEHRYPIARIAADFHVPVTRDSVAAVDVHARTVALGSGAQRSYGTLIVAVGARHAGTIAGAVAFRGAQDAAKVKALLIESHSGRHRRVAFVVPGGHTWSLPLYELALHTSSWLTERGVSGVPLTVVSPEPSPLATFGSRASDEVAALLARSGIGFVSGQPIRHEAGRLRHEPGRLLLAGGRSLESDLSIALVRLEGPRIRGLPSDEEGFLPVDELGRVDGAPSVFAAGDATTFPLKQGGLATQQADAIAEYLASELEGRSPGPASAPVLRAVLFGGHEKRYLQAELGEALHETSICSSDPLWPESSKLVGRYLAPYLDSLGQGAAR
jgi:sulfide:quinone oxidoreductase